MSVVLVRLAMLASTPVSLKRIVAKFLEEVLTATEAIAMASEQIRMQMSTTVLQQRRIWVLAANLTARFS